MRVMIGGPLAFAHETSVENQGKLHQLTHGDENKRGKQRRSIASKSSIHDNRSLAHIQRVHVRARRRRSQLHHDKHEHKQ